MPLGAVAIVPLGAVAIVPLGTVATVQNFEKKKKRWLNKLKWHCRGIAFFYIVNR